MIPRLAIAISIVAALAAAAVGIRWGTFAAGGSDSTCYLGEARLFEQGSMHLDQPLARIAPWPAADWTFTPAGHVPSRVGPGLLVPMCPPGLPLLMTAFHVVGLSEFLVVPLLGGLLVWLTFAIGRSIEGPVTGAAAAVLMACSPIFLYQVVQPMTDVPAAAWWALVFAFAIGVAGDRERPFAAGLAASAAVMTRPNLAPVAGLVGLYFLLAGSRGRRIADAALFGAGLLPGVAAVALIQRAMYGGALASGYGTADQLFTTMNVVPNLHRYPFWLLDSHTPFLLLAVAAPWSIRRAAHAWLALGIAAMTLACYLAYYVFNDWWYIRFLLPAIPLLVILSVSVVVNLLRRLTPRLYLAGAAVGVAVLAGWWVHMARAGHAFELRRLDRHFVEAGEFIASRLPARAAILTVRHSGSTYYYAGRPTVLWDMLDPNALDPALAFLRGQNYTPFIVVEIDEEAPFRARFGPATGIGWLDWPPLAELDQTIRVYNPDDRSRFLAHEDVRTEYVWNDLESARLRRR